MQEFWDLMHGNPWTMLSAVVVPYVGRLEFIGWAYGKVRACFCSAAPATKEGLSIEAFIAGDTLSWADSCARVASGGRKNSPSRGLYWSGGRRSVALD
eukprot:4705093-Prymnesium_polylepis.1